MIIKRLEEYKEVLPKDGDLWMAGVLRELQGKVADGRSGEERFEWHGGRTRRLQWGSL